MVTNILHYKVTAILLKRSGGILAIWGGGIDERQLADVYKRKSVDYTPYSKSSSCRLFLAVASNIAGAFGAGLMYLVAKKARFIN